jgi:Ca2+-transporting ATPase
MPNQEWKHAVTAAFAGLVIIQMVNTFSAIAPTRSIFETNYLANPYHLWAVLLSVLLVLAIVYIPFMNSVLGTEPLGYKDWLIILLFSLVPMTFMELRKKYMRHTLVH